MAKSARQERAYNLQNAEVHTYHVGTIGALVHNECLPVLRNWSSQRFQFGILLFNLTKGFYAYSLKVPPCLLGWYH